MKGVEPDLILVEWKPGLYHREWEREALEEAIEDVRTEPERDLRPLLPHFVSCEVTREGVGISLN